MKRRLLLLACLVPVLGFMTIREAPAGRVLNDALVTHPFRHHIWQEVLMQNVGPDGEVDFAHVRAYSRRLNDYLGQLESASPENEPKAFPTQADQAAYWINAQNAITLRLILNHYPLTAISDVTDLDVNDHYKVGGMSYTLPQIRARAIQASPGLPVLFTMTNYSASAPPILPRAYEGKSLKQLSLQARKKALSADSLVKFKRSGGGCVVTQVSPFLKNFEASLFAPVATEAEDRDAFSEEPAEPSSHPMNWHDLLRPLAPPALYADLGQPCSQNVEWLPPDPTLRQLQLLRS
jgi:hypothetical protein